MLGKFAEEPQNVWIPFTRDDPYWVCHNESSSITIMKLDYPSELPTIVKFKQAMSLVGMMHINGAVITA